MKSAIAVSAAEPQESQADILRKIKNTQDVNEKKRLIAEYNASVSGKGKTSSDDAGICDVRKDLEWVLKRVSMNDIHFLFGFEQAEDFVNTRMDVKGFHHQLVFHMTRADAAEIGCSKKAVELAKDTFMYTRISICSAIYLSSVLNDSLICFYSSTAPPFKSLQKP